MAAPAQPAMLPPLAPPLAPPPAPIPFHIRPPAPKFKEKQATFALILSNRNFTSYPNGFFFINNQEIQTRLDLTVRAVLKALKDADRKIYKKNCKLWSYDIIPSTASLPRLENGSLVLAFEVCRNTGERDYLGALDNAGLVLRGIWIPWSGYGRGLDIARRLRQINAPVDFSLFQHMFRQIAGFWELASHR